MNSGSCSQMRSSCKCPIREGGGMDKGKIQIKQNYFISQS